MPEYISYDEGGEKILSRLRDEFVRKSLGETATPNQIAEATDLLVRYEQELINRGFIQLDD